MNNEDVFRFLGEDFFDRFSRGIVELMCGQCEIIVHDFRKGFEHAVVMAVNGELSGRKIGDEPRGAAILNFEKDIRDVEQAKPYFFTHKSGKIFKSTTTLVADDTYKVIGSVCLNIDVTQMLLTVGQFNQFLQTEDITQERTENSIYVNNVDDVLEHFVHNIEKQIGKPMALMSKAEKVQALGYLDARGVLKISKSSVLLGEKFNISKFTLYQYLDEARKSNLAQAEQ